MPLSNQGSRQQPGSRSAAADRYPPVEQIHAFKTLRFSCYGCGGSQGWWVQWESPFDKGYQCSRCSSSAVITREGRVIGRKSQDWQQAVDAYLLAAEVEWPLDEILDGLIV